MPTVVILRSSSHFASEIEVYKQSYDIFLPESDVCFSKSITSLLTLSSVSQNKTCTALDCYDFWDFQHIGQFGMCMDNGKHLST